MTNSRGKPARDSRPLGKSDVGKSDVGKSDVGKSDVGKPAAGSAPTPDQVRQPESSASQLGLPGGERFGKSMRLCARDDFDYLFQHGLVAVDPVLVIHARPATRGGQLGISVSKRVGNAPCRNRWKRLIREVYRRLAAQRPAVRRMDLVIRPRRGAQPSYAAIERSLASLTVRLDRQLGRREKS